MLRNIKHPIEKEVATLVVSNFPNYESFHKSHLLELIGETGWRNDTIPYLEAIGVASFGVLKSLNFINRNKNLVRPGDPDQKFKNIYIHFVIISDCVKNVARNIAFTLEYLELIDIEEKTKISRDKLYKNFEKFLTRYDKMFDDLITKGRAITHNVQNDNDYLKLLISKKNRKDYIEVVNQLKSYRNFFAHNPGVDVFRKGQEFLVIKRDNINDTNKWSEILNLSKNNPEYFTNPKEQIDNDLKVYLHHLNNIWGEFDIQMNKVKNSENYNEIAYGYARG